MIPQLKCDSVLEAPLQLGNTHTFKRSCAILCQALPQLTPCAPYSDLILILGSVCPKLINMNSEATSGPPGTTPVLIFAFINSALLITTTTRVRVMTLTSFYVTYLNVIPYPTIVLYKTRHITTNFIETSVLNVAFCYQHTAYPVTPSTLSKFCMNAHFSPIANKHSKRCC